MYQPLTARARRIIQLANTEALRFQHEYIGTEHSLLAIVSLKNGVAVQVLKHFGVDLRKVRGQTEALMIVGPRAIPIGARLPRTPRCNNVMQFAVSEASQMNHRYVGSEHVLLGLLREDMGVAAQILMNEGLKLREVRDDVMKTLSTGIRSLPVLSQRNDIEDFPIALTAALAELNDELRSLNSEKEQAVAAHDFEKAAALRDSALKLKTRKQAIIRDGISQYSIDPAWLSWGGGAALKLAQRINERCRWDALPELAAALEEAGCTDAEMIKHCQQAGEHSSQCWVVDLLLANAPPVT
jgi:ATP-dependent Clp protease ATP-binding subunit ClpA